LILTKIREPGVELLKVILIVVLVVITAGVMETAKRNYWPIYEIYYYRFAKSYQF